MLAAEGLIEHGNEQRNVRINKMVVLAVVEEGVDAVSSEHRRMDIDTSQSAFGRLRCEELGVRAPMRGALLQRRQRHPIELFSKLTLEGGIHEW